MNSGASASRELSTGGRDEAPDPWSSPGYPAPMFQGRVLARAEQAGLLCHVDRREGNPAPGSSSPGGDWLVELGLVLGSLILAPSHQEDDGDDEPDGVDHQFD